MTGFDALSMKGSGFDGAGARKPRTRRQSAVLFGDSVNVELRCTARDKMHDRSGPGHDTMNANAAKTNGRRWPMTLSTQANRRRRDEASAIQRDRNPVRKIGMDNGDRIFRELSRRTPSSARTAVIESGATSWRHLDRDRVQSAPTSFRNGDAGHCKDWGRSSGTARWIAPTPPSTRCVRDCAKAMVRTGAAV